MNLNFCLKSSEECPSFLTSSSQMFSELKFRYVEEDQPELYPTSNTGLLEFKHPRNQLHLVPVAEHESLGGARGGASKPYYFGEPTEGI